MRPGSAPPFNLCWSEAQSDAIRREHKLRGGWGRRGQRHGRCRLVMSAADGRASSRVAREQRSTSMANKLRCRLGKCRWRSRGRGDALSYFCQDCGKHSTSCHARGWGRRGPETAWLRGGRQPPARGRRGGCEAQCRFEAHATAPPLPAASAPLRANAIARPGRSALLLARRLRKRRPWRGTRRGWSRRPRCAYARAERVGTWRRGCSSSATSVGRANPGDDRLKGRKPERAARARHDRRIAAGRATSNADRRQRKL
jgi:hypothetical protein